MQSQLARVLWIVAVEGVGELTTARSHQTIDADDLAARDLQVDVLEVPGAREAARFQHDLAARRPDGTLVLTQIPADDQADQALPVDSLDRSGLHEASIAKDRVLIGDAEDVG